MTHHILQHRPKPHLFRDRYQWVCVGEGRAGYGSSWQFAYLSWFSGRGLPAWSFTSPYHQFPTVDPSPARYPPVYVGDVIPNPFEITCGPPAFHRQ